MGRLLEVINTYTLVQANAVVNTFFSGERAAFSGMAARTTDRTRERFKGAGGSQ
jgi:hypothetical protein